LTGAGGIEALSVALHTTASSVLVGVMFAARFGDEAGLFCLARWLEEVRSWANTWPDI
tara:strand:+ start:6923 stop:7096 length:174 start_codon:yes stop_codon:yes gene_type:complete